MPRHPRVQPSQVSAWPSPQARARLRAALHERPRGLFCDVDGVLSPIAPTPDEARLQPGAAEALAAARDAFDLVAIVSGRAAGDAWRMVNVPGLLYIGNHGFERLTVTIAGVEDVTLYPPAAPWLSAINAALDDIRASVAPVVPGALFESKGATATIHWRLAPDPDAAEVLITAEAEAAAARHGVRVTHGRMVVELRPPIPMDKGVAVASVAREQGLRGAIYLGDDRTDIDAFHALRDLTTRGGLAGAGVAVLHDEAPPELARAATITLPEIEQVPPFLRWLAAAASTDASIAPSPGA